MNLKDMPPKNVFVINDEYDAETLLMHIQKNNLLSSHGNDWKFSQKNYFKFFVYFTFFLNLENIVIYGLDLNVLCTIQALNNFGIDYSRFVIIAEKNV